jgi:hypothetical protein
VRKFWIPLVIVALLAAAYFGSAAVLDANARRARADAEGSGVPVTLDASRAFFAPGSRATAETLLAAAELLDDSARADLEYLDSVGWRENPAATAASLGTRARAYELLMRAAQMEPANFGIDLEAGMKARLAPVLRDFPAFRLLLSATARTLAVEGRADSAVAVLAASARLCRVLAEPVLVYSLVEHVGFDTVAALAGRFAPDASPAALERFADAAAGLDFGADLARSISGECFWVDHALENAQTFQSFGDEGTSTPTTLAVWFLPLRRYAQWMMLRGVRDMLAFARLPWHEGLPLLEAHERTYGGKGPLGELKRLGIAAMRPFYGRAERHNILRDAALYGLAVLAARRAGVEPPALPTDRATGRPLVLRVEGDGFVVYSTGLDGSDDGGDAEKDIAFRVGR